MHRSHDGWVGFANGGEEKEVNCRLVCPEARPSDAKSGGLAFLGSPHTKATENASYIILRGLPFHKRPNLGHLARTGVG